MREVAGRAGLKSVAFIADLERGFRNPSPEVLARIERALELEPGALRDADQRPPVHEIKELVVENPEWAVAFRRVVDAARKQGLKPRQLIKRLEQPDEIPAKQ